MKASTYKSHKWCYQSPISIYVFVNRQSILEFILCSEISGIIHLRVIYNNVGGPLYWQTTNRDQELSSGPMGNMEGRVVIFQKATINISPPKFFHLSRVENGKDDSQSVAHVNSTKPVGILF
jgi:hypothetical protein